jgi:HPt (histidine-containing phosphotransfer) domain-containing protein
MDDYVSKPIQPEELLRSIGKFVTAPGTDKDPAAPERDTGDCLLDRATLLARLEGNGQLLLEILQLCSGEFTRIMKELECAVVQQDARRIRLAAHTLKGMFGNLSATHAYEVALLLEDMGRKGELDQAWEMFRLLQGEVEQVERDVARIQSEMTA